MHLSKNSLLQDICRCSNIYDCLCAGNKNNPCFKITTAQKVGSISDFQVPEPWSGNIDTAPLLFIGDHISINYEEEYPVYGWPDYRLENYFNFRFSGGHKQWIKDGLYPLCKEGNHALAWNRFWSACKNRALELHRKVDIAPGLDFSTSLAVRCRTVKTTGVEEAANECIKCYLEKVICLSGAAVIVGLGKLASASIRSVFCNQDKNHIYGPVAINKKERFFAFLPHHNAKGPRTFGETISVAEMDRLVAFLNHH